jgi:hypothetical protein
MLPAFPAELGLCLWLIAKGVDVRSKTSGSDGIPLPSAVGGS